jgi:hypothetical protein
MQSTGVRVMLCPAAVNLQSGFLHHGLKRPGAGNVKTNCPISDMLQKRYPLP